MTLTDFLLARIAEDEQVAQAAYGAEWRVELGGAILGNVGEEAGMIADYTQPADGKHIARHDPARVLAECEAKRLVVEQWMDHGWTGPGWDYMRDRMLSLLASPYADHPDYRQEWKP